MAKLLLTFFFLISTAQAAPAVDFYAAEKAKKPAPVLVFVHGGAWISGDKSEYTSLGQAFAKSGLCVLIPNYELAPKAMHPKPVDELESLLKEAPKLTPGCDAGRVFLAGHSAGAHMIAAWNASHENTAVKGFIGLEGIYDLPDLAARFPTYSAWFLKKAFGPEENWAKASPARLKPKGKAPWLLIHSTADELVDLAQTEKFAAHLREEGSKATVLVLQEGKHDEVIRRFGNPQDLATKKAFEFINP